jgi:hypothetical protein
MRKICFVIFVVIISLNFAFGQNTVIGPIVNHPSYFDVSAPLRDVVKKLPSQVDNSWKDGIVKNRFNVHRKPLGRAPGGFSDPNLQTRDGLLTTSDTTIQNFDGNTNSDGDLPPDTHGDVSATQYFQVVNVHYSIYSKTGTLLLGPLANSTMWNGMPNNSNDGDAIVLYDEQANRWLFSQFSLPNYPNGPFYQMIAVSQTGDPTGSWYRWQYTFTNMGDYPKFGIWADGYYMSAHMFASGTGTYAGILAAAYDRDQMISGNSTATMVMFTKPASDEAFGWLPSDCDGPFPTGNPPNYFVYADNTSSSHLGVYEFHVDWSNTSNSTFGNFLSLPVNSYTNNLTGVSQKGTTRKLDPINDRMMYRLQYRKFSTYHSMVVNHTVDISSSVAGIRWYELRKTSGAWSLYQQSTYSLSDGNSRWMGSIAQDSSGNIALGYSVSGTNLYPSIRYCGRMKNDALNTMTIAEKGIYNGGGSQTYAGTPGRWGDYSALSVDPSATATFWYTQEYYATTSTSNWKTRIASFSFVTSFTVTASANPQYINSGQNSQLNVVATGGTGTYSYSWTSLPVGFTSNIQNPTVSPTVTTKYIAHVTSGTQVKTDTTTVFINMTALATANPYTINAGSNSQLNVTGTGGTGSYTYSWTSNPAGFTSTLQNPVVSPTVNTVYTGTAISGTQSASDTAKVKVNMSVLATATPPSIVAGGSSQLNAVVTGGSGTNTYAWTSIPTGFTSNIQNPVVSPIVTTQYIVNANDGTQTKGDTVTVTVTLGTLSVIATATPSSVCIGSSSQLNAQASGGTTTYTYSWTSLPVGFTSNIQNPIVQPTITTTYIAHVNDGSSSASDSVTVTVTQDPTAFAGNDTTICLTTVQLQLNGQSSNSSAVNWTTNGDGTFLNQSSLNAIYYPGVNDKANLHFNLTLTASPQPPCTPNATSVRHITFDHCTGLPDAGNDVFNVSIRPNPSFGSINLLVTGLTNGNVKVSIVDLSGKAVFQDIYSPTGNKVNQLIDLTNLQKGIYFVKVETDSQIKTEKLVLE